MLSESLQPSRAEMRTQLFFFYLPYFLFQYERRNENSVIPLYIIILMNETGGKNEGGLYTLFSITQDSHCVEREKETKMNDNLIYMNAVYC